MGRLPAAVPKTISAADQLRRSACPPDILRQASDLLLALAAVECHVSAGGPARVPPALVHDLVIITARHSTPAPFPGGMPPALASANLSILPRTAGPPSWHCGTKPRQPC